MTRPLRSLVGLATSVVLVSAAALALNPSPAAAARRGPGKVTFTVRSRAYKRSVTALVRPRDEGPG